MIFCKQPKVCVLFVLARQRLLAADLYVSSSSYDMHVSSSSYDMHVSSSSGCFYYRGRYSADAAAAEPDFEAAFKWWQACILLLI
jgi:hypothetical protein